MASSRKCKLSADCFCYVCGLYVSLKQVKYKINLEAKFAQAYERYFSMKIGDQDKNWAPHVICGTCRSNLDAWLKGDRHSMPFAIPRVWREPQNLTDDGYFCMVDISRFKKTKNRRDIVYPSIPSSIASVPHSSELPITKPPANKSQEDLDLLEELGNDSDNEYTASDSDTKNEPHFPNQEELNDLIRDMGLTKSNAELLTSRLKQWNLLDTACRSSLSRKRHERFSKYFSVAGSLCFCHDVDGLFQEIGILHDPNKWRLFIDSSSRSLKCVLLYNGNQHPSIPIGHSVQMKEDYENVKFLLETINYSKYKWQLCGDFKMIGFLKGMQGGYTKHSCFLCLWDTRAASEHYIRKEWPKRNQFVPGCQNVKYTPLVASENILMPPLHIKPGLVKQFVKALNKDGDAFQHIDALFPYLSDAKKKAGIFTGPQITQMLRSEELTSKMTATEAAAWKTFRDVVENFLGNKHSSDYKILVNNLMEEYEKMGCP